MDEARISREERNRPFVVIDFEIEQTIIHLVITNSGPAIARNVTFEFNPPLQSTFDHDRPDRDEVADLTIFTEGIPSLAPGKRLATILDSFPQLAERKTVPFRYDVTVRYEDQRGHQFDEKTILDLNVYWNLTHIERRGLRIASSRHRRWRH